MRMFRLPRLATTALALLAAGGTALAASPAPQVIEVPAGAVVLVLPGGAVPMMAPGAAPVMAFDEGLLSPAAMIRQVNQMIQQALGDPSGDRLLAAALRQMQAGFPAGPGLGGLVSEVVVTTVSNGRESCTRQVTYSGGQAAPKMDVRVTGHGCSGAGLLAAAPGFAAPGFAAPERGFALPELGSPEPAEPMPTMAPPARTLRVDSHRPGTVQLAQLER